MIKRKWLFLLLLLLCLTCGGVLAQMYSGRSSSFGGRGGRGGSQYPDQMSVGRGRSGISSPQYIEARGRQSLFEWDVDPEFPQDLFTFVRVRYGSGYGMSGYGFYGGQGSFMGSMMSSGRGGRGGMGGMSVRGGGMGGGKWSTDYPDSDNNFSYRLHQVTSIDVNPAPIYIDIENPELFNYPFLYIVEPGGMSLSSNEVKILRQYLLNGGFLMLDDFWGTTEWYNVYTQMKKIFPEREPVQLTLDHPIFHTVFEIKEIPQIPAYNIAVNLSTDTLTGVTSERGADSPKAIFYGIYDDKGRMMVIIDRDTDLGDGWEREGISKTYFSEFSEKKAYPLGINIIVYAMTH